MGNSITAKGNPEPYPIPLRIRLYPAPAPRSPESAHPGKAAAGETPGAAGCLRGLGWGLAIEGTAALLVYAIWRAVLVLR